MVGRAITGISVALLVACGNTGSNPVAPQQQQLPAEQFRAALSAWAAAPGHYGVSASVILADGTQWSGVAGFGGMGEPMRLEHLIAVASITKTMTGAITLQLADEARLSLDDPISLWLPAREYIDPAITIRQLLNHTSGVANYTLNPALGQSATTTVDSSTMDLLQLYLLHSSVAFRMSSRSSKGRFVRIYLK